MKVCRFLSSKELKNYRKGKTIRPLPNSDWMATRGEWNELEAPAVCFFNYEEIKKAVNVGTLPNWALKSKEEEYFSALCYAQEYISEELRESTGGYFAVFEVNSKKLKDFTGWGEYQNDLGWGSDQKVLEYHLPCYNKKMAKLVALKVIPRMSYEEKLQKEYEEMEMLNNLYY